MEYTHKITGAKLRLKKSFGSVGSFYTDKPEIFGWGIISDTVVCSFENIEFQQLKLF